MKKITALILALTAILALSACGTTARTYRRSPYTTRTVTDTAPDFNNNRTTVVPNVTDLPAPNGRRIMKGSDYGGNYNRAKQESTTRGEITPFTDDYTVRDGTFHRTTEEQIPARLPIPNSDVTPNAPYGGVISGTTR